MTAIPSSSAIFKTALASGSMENNDSSISTAEIGAICQSAQVSTNNHDQRFLRSEITLVAFSRAVGWISDRLMSCFRLSVKATGVCDFSTYVEVSFIS